VADKDGNSVAGVIYRPISAPPIWAVGCKSEDCKRTNISPPRAGAPREPQLVTTNGSISKFTDELIARGMARVKSGGCGNKSLLLLEGKGSAYIQDRGVSRWDTCAPEAVLAAFGGMLLKLNHVLAHPDSLTRQDHLPKESRYCYLETTTNLDFVPGEVCRAVVRVHVRAPACTRTAAGSPRGSPRFPWAQALLPLAGQVCCVSCSALSRAVQNGRSPGFGVSGPRLVAICYRHPSARTTPTTRRSQKKRRTRQQPTSLR